MTLRLLTALAPLLATAAASGDSIVLLDSVRLADGEIRLSDIAELRGDYASGLGAIVVGSLEQDADRAMELRITDVRRLLDEHGVHWGRIELSGQTVAVRASVDVHGSAPLAMQPLDTSNRLQAAPRRSMQRSMAASLIDRSTLRGWIARRIATVLEVDPTNLQLDFPADRSAMLDAPLDGARFEVKLLNSPKQSKRLEFEVRRWVDGRPTTRDLITVEPAVRTTVATLRTDVPRGRPILAEHIEAVEQWMSPLERLGRVSPEAIDGQAAAIRLRTGTMLRQRDLEQPVLIRRGDEVRVSCFVGGAVMTLRATAEAGGIAGDTIRLRKGRERTTFTARITARGEAVLELDGSTPNSIADASTGATP